MDYPLDKNLCETVAEVGDLDMIKCLLDLGCQIDFRECARTASRKNMVHIIEYCFNQN